MSTQTQEKKNFKSTLNLPQTAFPMEAKLTTNEPAPAGAVEGDGTLRKAHEPAHATAKRWVLHDGPPFANGDIHLGHLINKTLKDVILRFRSMQGYQTPYVPGWDCHGLPIEHKIQQDLGPKLRQMSVADVRKLCFEYADKYCKVQSEQFQRLGILGEWGKPYLTMSAEYEAQTLEVFARFVEAGLVYQAAQAGAVVDREPDGVGGCGAGIPGRDRPERVRGVPDTGSVGRISACLDHHALDFAGESGRRGQPEGGIFVCPLPAKWGAP